MATEQTNSNPTPVTGAWRLLWGRRLAVATAIVFSISAIFPTVAAFVRDTEPWPNWWGVLDVSLAFFLAALAFAVLGLARGKVNKEAEEASYRAYRALTHGILAVLVVFYFLGDRVV